MNPYIYIYIQKQKNLNTKLIDFEIAWKFKISKMKLLKKTMYIDWKNKGVAW
jgi:hypothetical protein